MTRALRERDTAALPLLEDPVRELPAKIQGWGAAGDVDSAMNDVASDVDRVGDMPAVGKGGGGS